MCVCLLVCMFNKLRLKNPNNKFKINNKTENYYENYYENQGNKH